MITRKTSLALAAATMAAGGLGAFALASPKSGGSDRRDCPGKIVCPLTGELVCRGQCPEAHQQRDDCPGRIECPLNGALVCKDQCPLNSESTASAEDALPACCRK